jgi:aspartate-semialdehyde dehydrogenase
MKEKMTIKNKIPVGVLGATGSVGQKFIQLLNGHPFFAVTEVAASDRSAGKRYENAVNWILATGIPENAAQLTVKSTEEQFTSKLLFSAMDSSVAGPAEEMLAKRGHVVVSNSKNHRWDTHVPLLVPEVNHEHLELVQRQPFGGGAIVTNPNCSTIGLALVLKPLLDRFGLEAVNVVTMQALSGAGYPGVASLDILDNVVPFISGEEEKLEMEPRKIFGKLSGDTIELANIAISAQTNRVAVLDGHLESVQVTLTKKAPEEELIAAWENYSSLPQELDLPFAPKKPIYYFREENYPQPRLHRDLDKGMAASVGRLRPCNLFDYKFTILSHNTIRGAAGGSILCAELMAANGMI